LRVLQENQRSELDALRKEQSACSSAVLGCFAISLLICFYAAVCQRRHAKRNVHTYVQRRAGGGSVVNLNQTGWVSATGQMAISVADGVISFYENGELKYSETYQLSTYNVYVYVFVSSAPGDGVGTDAFDNFAYTPNQAPSTPEVTGPSPPVYVGWSYSFSACSTDPDLGDMVQYTFDWGDGTAPTTTSFRTSGETAYETHSWIYGGVYWVTVTAQDNHGLASVLLGQFQVSVQYYQSQDTAMVVLYAYDDYGRQLVADVYMDSQYLGQTLAQGGRGFIVYQNNHTFQFSEPQGNDFIRYISNDMDNNFTNPVVYSNSSATVPVFGTTSVSAYYLTSNPPSPTGYDYGNGRGSVLFSTDWIMPSADLQLVSSAFSTIYGYFNAQGGYGHLLNYKSQTTLSSVTSQIADLQTHDWSTFFYYGHMGVEAIPNYTSSERFGIHVQGNPNDQNPTATIWDTTDIYPCTNGGLKFVFLWVCNNANLTGHSPGTGDANPIAHGAAYCWTRQPNLSNDSYARPDDGGYCFISFAGASPTLLEPLVGNSICKDWLVSFYNNLLVNQYTINRALDEASYAVGYEGWTDGNNKLSQEGYKYHWYGGAGQGPDDFYGQMKVYGNGRITL
jgi:hypothetical protein